MKLKEFNTENTKARVDGLPSIGVNQTTGLFNINRFACEKIGLGNNDQVVFLQDEETPENWYLEKVKDKGFTCRIKENVTSGRLFNNVSIARQIGISVKIDGSYRILIAGEPTKVGKRILHGLIVKTKAE